jgi:hypothetical protein
MLRRCSLLATAVVWAHAAELAWAKELELQCQDGLRLALGQSVWCFQRGPAGWALGSLRLGGQPLETAWTGGLVTARQTGTNSNSEVWLPAATGTKHSDTAATFAGTAELPSGTLSFAVSIQLLPGPSSSSAITRVLFNTSWEYTGSDGTVWLIGLPFMGDTMTHGWRSQIYPWAGNSSHQPYTGTPLQYNGVPAVTIFRPDWDLALLHSLDIAEDVQNPTTWTGKTAYDFDVSSTSPRWLLELGTNEKRAAAVQLFVSDAGSVSQALTGLVEAWRSHNRYAVQPLHVRTVEAAYKIFIEGRKNTKEMWFPGEGYEVQRHSGCTTQRHNGDFICLTSSSLSAYTDFQSGDEQLRNRSGQQLDWILQAQNTNASSPHFGAIHSTFELWDKRFTSNDRGHSPGLKVDEVAMMARYLLETWQAVLVAEHRNVSRWYTAGLRAAQWVARQQNTHDGGLPNRILLSPTDNWDDAGRPSISVVSGRALGAMPVIYNITGDESVGRVIPGLEKFLRRCEQELWFTGQHPDLHAGDFEPNSVWGAVEYWLGKHERTGEAEALERAVADANLAFLMWCPKQLSWVSHPTQTAFTEQQDYLQYSQYVYENKKVLLLMKLTARTHDPLWQQLAHRIIQMNLYVQVTAGDCKGALQECIADPWLARRGGFDFMGSLYFDQLNIDLFSQLVEAGLVPQQGATPVLGYK